MDREEAVLDLEVRSAEVPCLYLDVTVRHAVPGDAERLARASRQPGATNAVAEQDKRDRYPNGRAPWKAEPLALESYGRHGAAAGVAPRWWKVRPMSASDAGSKTPHVSTVCTRHIKR